MVGVFGEKVSLGQANGGDVELIVRGTELYATYETVDGYPALYNDTLGLFCYASLVNGAFEATSTPITQPPPQNIIRHATESDEIRAKKINDRMLRMDRRAQASPIKEE